MGADDGFEVIDGLAAQRLGFEEVFSSPRVRIRATLETNRAGWAGVVGEVTGETRPSRSGVEVIGNSTYDYAINVWSDERGEQAWFAPELVEPND